MVFFTCNACGESLKKSQIEKHLSGCRGCKVLSCIDCGKDFWGDDYKGHVKCISEDQKYGGKSYEVKANKGDVKQQVWIQRVQATLDKPGVNARLSSVLEQVATYDNVPRKKAKFQNWMKNSLKVYDSNLQDQVWEIFSSSESPSNGACQPVHTSPPAPPAQGGQGEQGQPEEKKKNKRERKEERQKKNRKKRTEEEQNGENELRKKKKRKCAEDEERAEEEKSKKVKKRKEESEESQDIKEVKDEKEAQEESNTKGTFNWKGTIKAVLRQAPEEGIALKKLRKKVLSAYYSFSAEANHKSEEELYSLFNKKLKNPKFRILKEKVKLVK